MIIEKQEDMYFYRTRSGGRNGFLLAREERIYLIECKFRNRIKFPKIFSNFEERYPEKAKIHVVITEDHLGRKEKEKTYFIPIY